MNNTKSSNLTLHTMKSICLMCTFGASCYSSHLTWAQIFLVIRSIGLTISSVCSIQSLFSNLLTVLLKQEKIGKILDSLNHSRKRGWVLKMMGSGCYICTKGALMTGPEFVTARDVRGLMKFARFLVWELNIIFTSCKMKFLWWFWYNSFNDLDKIIWFQIIYLILNLI